MKPLPALVFLAAATTLPGCAGRESGYATPAPSLASTAAPLSREAERAMRVVTGGPFRRGSSAAERNQAYEDYLETSGQDGARKHHWFASESFLSQGSAPTFVIDAAPVTQAAYAEFVALGGVPAPFVSPETWRAQGFQQDYALEVKRYNWHEQTPPQGRGQHPVVLVSWAQANAYCHWRGRLVGEPRRLPSDLEFEKAARGPGQSAYPWGKTFDASRLNSAVLGPHDTVAVQSFPNGRSAVGASDMAGNVFQWTSTPWPGSKGRMTVKGSAWDDFGGVGRAASAHGRPAAALHVIVGFRCAGPGSTTPL